MQSKCSESKCVHASEYVGGVPLTACLMNSNALHECPVSLISVLCVLAKAKCEGYAKLFVFSSSFTSCYMYNSSDTLRHVTRK